MSEQHEAASPSGGKETPGGAEPGGGSGGEPAPDAAAQVGAVRLADVEPFETIAFVRRGPYWKLSGPLGRLRDFMAGARLDPSGPALGIFYDDPDEIPPEETRYALAYPVAPQAADRARELLADRGDEDEGGRLEVLEVEGGPCAVAEFAGPAKESGRAYAAVAEWMEQAGRPAAGPPREVYLAEPGTLGGGLLRMIIQQPVAP